MKKELNPAVVIAIIAIVVLAVIGFFVTNAGPREGGLRPNPGDYTREPGRDLAQELSQEGR